jgi:L-amino acid N-acyltransferase
MNSPLIRSATEVDLRSIHEIYNFYVETSTCTYQLEPEPFEDRVAWFRQHGPLHPAIVAESNSEVIGWGSLSPWKERAGYAGTVEASIYVHRDWHRRGVGKALLSDLILRARTLGHHVLIGGACTEHPGSIALQECLGFERVAYFRETGRKFDRWLDVIYLQMILTPMPASE